MSYAPYKEEGINKQVVGIIIIMFILSLLLCSYLVFKNQMQKVEKEYYKAQMLSFCEISKTAYENEYPNTYPCSKWIVEGE